MITKFNPKEEEIMIILWDKKKAFIQEIINELPKPRPHYNTVSSMVRKLEKEGFIGHTSQGRSHQYFAITKKKAYRSLLFDQLVNSFFNGSKKKFLSYAIEKLRFKKSDLRSLNKKRK